MVADSQLLTELIPALINGELPTELGGDWEQLASANAVSPRAREY